MMNFISVVFTAVTMIVTILWEVKLVQYGNTVTLYNRTNILLTILLFSCPGPRFWVWPCYSFHHRQLLTKSTAKLPARVFRNASYDILDYTESQERRCNHTSAFLTPSPFYISLLLSGRNIPLFQDLLIAVRGRDNSVESYSEGTPFESRPGHRLFW
jgi:hypothetical protein